MIGSIILKIIILFSIFCSFVFSQNEPNYIKPDEYTCLNNLRLKFNILIAENATGYLNYCFGNAYCTSGSINSLYLSSSSSDVLLLTDITCFPNVETIVLSSFTISKDLYFYQFPISMKYISYSTATLDFDTFDQVISQTLVFSLSLRDQISNYYMKMSSFLKVKTLYISSYIYLENDVPLFTPTMLNSVFFNLFYFPDFSSLSTINGFTLNFNDQFQMSSLSNFSKLALNNQVLNVNIIHTLERSYPTYFMNGSGKIDNLRIDAVFDKPTSMLNGLNLNYKKLELNYIGPDFNVDGKFPFITNPLTSYSINGGNFIEIPPTNIFSLDTLLVQNNFTQNLPNFTGNALSFDLSFNSITGTIDPSWCSTYLQIRGNQMSGAVPPCFACYFSDNEMFLRFSGGNTFTNLVPNNPCPTFAPQVYYKNATGDFATLEFSGIDIGFNPEQWYAFNSAGGTIGTFSYKINTSGKNYSVTYSQGDFSKDYFNIKFNYPAPSRTIPFPKFKVAPAITSVQVLNNQFIIGGKYFSSYLGHYNENIILLTITSGARCSVDTTSIFSMACNISSLSILQENSFKLLKMQQETFTSRVLLNTADGTINNKTCPGDCPQDHICNLYNGICELLIECTIDCGSHGKCNYTSGKCSCDAGFQGNDCNSPVLSCPNDCTSSLNGVCDTYTGLCSCNPKFEGNDCSLIKCLNNCTSPSNGVCNKSTGICSCTTSYQGDDCSVPFIPCPNDCTGINGQCNNRTGICSCDIKYTTKDCSIPNQVISSISPSTTSGGNATFSGWFGNIHTGLSITIGGKQCKPILSISSDEIVCNAPTGTGINIVVLTQNNIVYSSKTLYKYLETVLKCPNDCTNLNQGTCDTSTGNCNCINGYTSYDCSIKGNNGNGNGNGNPPTNTTVDPSTGGTNITNQEINFQIYLKSLYEIDFNGQIVKEYSLQSNWTFNKTENNEVSIYTFSQSLSNSPDSTIVSTVEEITIDGGKQFSFAGSTFKLDQGSIKYSISINNYKYSSNLNTLKLDMISLVEESSSSSEEDCNTQDTEIDTHNVDNLSSFNYIKISKDNKVFSGRFINKLLSDGKSTFYSTSVQNDSNSITISLNLAHCENCVIDPDFSVLITADFKSSCNDSSSSKKWIIPIAVCVPIVGIAIIGTISYLFYKKRYIERPFKIKMKGFAKKF